MCIDIMLHMCIYIYIHIQYIRHYIIVYHTILYCTILYCIVLHCFTLYYTYALHLFRYAISIYALAWYCNPMRMCGPVLFLYTVNCSNVLIIGGISVSNDSSHEVRLCFKIWANTSLVNGAGTTMPWASRKFQTRQRSTTQHDTSDTASALGALLYDRVTKGWPSFLEIRGSAEAWLDQLQSWKPSQTRPMSSCAPPVSCRVRAAEWKWSSCGSEDTRRTSCLPIIALPFISYDS